MLGNENLFVRRNVILVRVRNESETLRIPWIQPQVLLRQKNPALVTNFNHKKSYFWIRPGATGPMISERSGLVVDT
ncbi:MAG: hypothetical protein C5B58_16360 [Acidobacteria bacterium]|nr:MAG: hypothetical protein C5B58_16360 [Acidobacteriota bacterium]